MARWRRKKEHYSKLVLCGHHAGEKREKRAAELKNKRWLTTTRASDALHANGAHEQMEKAACNRHKIAVLFSIYYRISCGFGHLLLSMTFRYGSLWEVVCCCDISSVSCHCQLQFCENVISFPFADDLNAHWSMTSALFISFFDDTFDPVVFNVNWLWTVRQGAFDEMHFKSITSDVIFNYSNEYKKKYSLTSFQIDFQFSLFTRKIVFASEISQKNVNNFNFHIE